MISWRPENGHSRITEDSIDGAGYGSIAEGIYNLGLLMKPGLTLREFGNSVTKALFFGKPGHGINALNLDANGVSLLLSYTILEPTTLALLTVAPGFFGINRNFPCMRHLK